MTKYTVLWDQAREANFIDLWLRSDSKTRSVLTAAANWIDSILSVAPELKGQEIQESLRVLAVPIAESRVSAVFQIIAADRQVRIIRLIFRNA